MRRSIWLFRVIFTLPYWRMNTPRSCFRSIRTVLENMLEERLGERPDFLFDTGNSDNDRNSEGE